MRQKQFLNHLERVKSTLPNPPHRLRPRINERTLGIGFQYKNATGIDIVRGVALLLSRKARELYRMNKLTFDEAVKLLGLCPHAANRIVAASEQRIQPLGSLHPLRKQILRRLDFDETREFRSGKLAPPHKRVPAPV